MVTYTTAIIHAFSPSKHVLSDQLTHAHIHYSYYPCFQPLKTCTQWSTNSCSHTLQLLSMLSAPQTCTRWSTNMLTCITAIIHAFSPSKHVLGDQLTHGHIHYSYYLCFQPLKHVLGDQLTHAHIHYSYYPCLQPLKTCTRWSTNSCSHTLQLLSMLSAPQNMYSVIN